MKTNVVQYIAGYVCRKVQTRIDQSSLPNKPSLAACLHALLEDEPRRVENSDRVSSSINWIKAVDRGDLLHVKEGTYMLFIAMEEVVREHLHVNKMHAMTEGYKTTVVRAITESEEVLFHQ